MYGIALEGGGARGSYQIGVWKALRELGIDYSAVVGTSVGALNGAMMVQGEFEQAFEIWSEMNPAKVINLAELQPGKDQNFDFSLDNGKEILHYLRTVIRDRGLDITPLRQLLTECIDEKKIRNSGKLLGIVTISFSNLNPLELFLNDIPSGQLIDYLIASANLPVFKVERVNGKLFLDGGFYNNLPINMLELKGYRDIIAVRLNRFGLKKKVNEEKLNITYLNPSESLGKILNFSNERAKRNIKVGYYDAIKLFKGYEGKKYCVEIDKTEDYFFNFFLRLEGSKLEQFLEALGLPTDVYQRRYIFEKLIPMISELMGIPSSSSYEIILLSLLERAAEQMGIERLKIYQWDELLEEVIAGYKRKPKTVKHLLPKLFKGNELVLKAAKSQILDQAGELLF